MRYLLLTILFCAANAFSYQEVIVKTVSKTETTFVLAIGKEDGVIEGMDATFTTNDSSVIARAEKASRNYSQWRLLNEVAKVPFKKNQIVVYNQATEHIWALMPSDMVQEVKKKHYPKKHHSIIARSSFVKGLTQSSSGTNVDLVNPDRAGFQIDLVYEVPFNNNIAISGGFKIAQESIATGYEKVSSTRYLVIGEATIYLPAMTYFFDAQIYASGVVGVGKTSTNIGSETQTGTIRLMPGARLGINLPINKEFDFMVEGALDAVNISEQTKYDTKQTSDQTDAKLTFGLRMYL